MNMSDGVAIAAIVISILFPIWIGNNNRIAFEATYTSKVENMNALITELKNNLKENSLILRELELTIASIVGNKNNYKQ